MELKHTSPNGVVVLKRMLNYVQLFFEKLLKPTLETDPIHYFFKNFLRYYTN